MALKPLGDRVIVKADEAEAQTASGLYLAPEAKEKPQTGVVIAVGEGTCIIIVTTVEGNFIATCTIKVTDGGSSSGSGVKGDVTGDGSVDIGDVNAVINIMLGKE